MTFEEYSVAFGKNAQCKKRSNEFIQRCLVYAKTLYASGVPVIYDIDHLAQVVLVKKEFLLRMSNASDKFYRSFYIPKKNGDKRLIEEPLPSLKNIQRWILSNILYQIPVSPFSKAFERGKGIKDNARFHIGQKVILKLDIKDFFPSVRECLVYNVFRKLGYTKRVATTLTKLCCLRGQLPQGAPTSPYLSNIIMLPFDKKFMDYAKGYQIRYSRYADDLTFSGNFDDELISHFIVFCKSVLKRKHFFLNADKVKVLRSDNRQIVTGIVVNKYMRAPVEMRRQLRQDMYYILKYGIDDHVEHRRITNANYVNHLLGIANFIHNTNRKDKEVIGYLKILKEILSNSKVY